MAGTGLSDEAVSAACSEGHSSTKDYMMQQTMLRVKDPARSLDFYTRVLGMTLLQKIDFPSMRFTLYFLGYEDKSDIPADIKERTAWTFSRRATIELTQICGKIFYYRVIFMTKYRIPKDCGTVYYQSNWGSQLHENLSYHNGNSEPHGFGHIGIAVPDVQAACKVFEREGATFVKKPDSGKIKDLAFIQDPDGYWIEILSPATMTSSLAPSSTSVSQSEDN